MAKYRIEIRGPIVPSSYKFYYDYFGMDATCPRDVSSVIMQAVPGDDIEIYINSPGGVVEMGSEIYTTIREAARQCNVKIYITGAAHSAASVIAMAGYCEMAPTALMLVHCTSSSAQGNHSELERVADILSTADRAICKAYMAKTGMSQEEVLQMMENESWLTAEQAKEKRLVDAVMFEKPEQPALAAGVMFRLPTEEMLEAVRKTMTAGQEEAEKETTEARAARCRYRALVMAQRTTAEN